NVGLTAAVERVLADAARRLEEWQQIEAIIPTMDLRPRVAAELPGDSVTVDAPSWRFLVSIDGRRNLHALARKLGLSRFEARRRLKQLLDLGLVEIDADQPRASIPHEPDEEVGASTAPSGMRFPRKRKAMVAPSGGDEDAAAADGPAPDAPAAADADADA